MICQNCGAEMPSGTIFCRKCGAKLPTENSGETQYCVIVRDTGANTKAVIGEIQKIKGFSKSDIKALLNSGSCNTVSLGSTREAAEQFRERLEALGASAEVTELLTVNFLVDPALLARSKQMTSDELLETEISVVAGAGSSHSVCGTATLHNIMWYLNRPELYKSSDPWDELNNITGSFITTESGTEIPVKFDVHSIVI